MATASYRTCWGHDGMRPLKFRPNRSTAMRVTAFPTFSNVAVVCHLERQQELSYRKQIARQLRTQYVEGIHRHKYYTVTLKVEM